MTEQEKFECPLCLNRALVVHCPDSKCGWRACQNVGCLAVLDLPRALGHLDPNRVIEYKTKQIRRLRLWIRGGVWLERDVA